MSAPQKPSEVREAVAVLDALLAAIPPSTGSRERRIREALRVGQRALREPGVRELDALADELGSKPMRIAAADTAGQRAKRAIERYYSRQP